MRKIVAVLLKIHHTLAFQLDICVLVKEDLYNFKIHNDKPWCILI